MGKGIKTRNVAEKGIKAIDKAAVASERMKEAYICPTVFLLGLKIQPVKLSTNLTSRAEKGLRPPKRTFPR